MLVFTKSFVEKLGKWLTTPPERFLLVMLTISFVYANTGILCLTIRPDTFWLGVKDSAQAVLFLVYGYPIYLLLKEAKQ